VLKHFLSFLISVLFASYGLAQKQGIPLIKNFELTGYNSSIKPQNWATNQLPSGEILIANDAGLLVYNGRQWKLYEEEVMFVSHSLLTIDNKCYVGGESSVYEIQSDSLGGLLFNSVLPLLPDSMKEIGAIEGIIPQDNGLVFHSDNYLFSLKNDQLTYIYSGAKIRKIFILNNQIYASVDDRGLLRLENETLVPTLGYKNFVDNSPISMSAIEGGIKVLTEKGGFFFIEIDVYGYERKVTHLDSELDSFFESHNLDDFVPLDNNSFGVATENNGFYILNSNGQIENHLDISKGLQDETVNGVFEDNYGSLWLALSNGISRVDISYPVDVIDGREGLEGIVESMTIHNNELFAATHTGVYSIPSEGESVKEVVPIQAWDILSYKTDEDSRLLIATNENVSELTADGQINSILECYPWKLFQPTNSTNTVIVGQDPGVSAIKMEEGKWVVGQPNRDVSSVIGNFTESNEKIWLGTRFSEIYSVNEINWQLDSTIYKGLQRYEWDMGLPEGDINTVSWKGEELFGTNHGFFKYENGKFRQEKSFIGLDSLNLIHRAYNWQDKDLWAITLKNDEFQFGYIDEENKWNYRLLNPITNDVVHSIMADQENNILLGGASGILRYKRQHNFDIETPYFCKLTKVYVMEDSLIHGGYWQDSLGMFTTSQPISSVPYFRYKTDAISFEYASLTFGEESDVKYAYWLEGNGKAWSKWTRVHKKEYTNLPPGDYVFKVKALNVFETESEVAEYHFTVNKPWFQSPWYYAGQTAVLALLVFLTVFLNHSENPSPYSSVIAFVTIITVFEFLIMIVEPYLIEYTGEIPVFNLIMNILLAMSLAPAERIIKKYLARKNHV